MPLLETYIKYLPEPTKSIMYLEKLHKRLSENEYSIGYKMKRATTSACKNGLELELFHKWEESKDVFARIMERGIEDAEISRESWDESVEQLGDWKLLIQYSEHKQDLSLVEYYWQDRKYLEHSALVNKLNISSHPLCVYYKNIEVIESKSTEESISFKEIEQEFENSVTNILAE